MWKKKIEKKRGRDGAKDEEEDGMEEDDWRGTFLPAHAGLITLDTIKASDEYAQRVIMGENHPKKKYAVCFGYLGSNYQGLQINPDAITIEALLSKALFLAGGIEECNYENLQKIGWTRAARTDRGVHAVAQLCGMKLRFPLKQEEAFVQSINTFLPVDIRVFELKRVTKSFNAKMACSSRRYQYLFPTYILTDAAIMNAYLKDSTVADARSECIGYRVSPDTLKSLTDTLKLFEGTRKYHNFTSQKSPNDASSQRYITSFTHGAPFVQGADGIEWICISIAGQSFLLNQIRKMVSLVFEIVRGGAPSTALDNAFSVDKVDIYMAPGLGLYLDKLYFDSYNKHAEYEAAKKKEREKRASDAPVAAVDDEDDLVSRSDIVS
jgi:tRNA pseudouridine38-40 synthase